MNVLDKMLLKSSFKNELSVFTDKLEKYVSDENGEWSIKGFIDVHKNIYTISSDTKIISKILEIHLFPQILQFAEESGYHLILAEHQNYYPDISFISKENEEIKFAVDIKTTYRKNNGIASFTLGSHGSYFKERDKKKNIQFPYSQYLGHYYMGVIYTRNSLSELIADTAVYQAQEINDASDTTNTIIGNRAVTTVLLLESISSVIRDLDFFVAEKWKIAGDKQGSGNTANIGCTLSLDDLRNENGIFSQFGEEWFDEYWINYGIATMVKEGKTIKITNLKDFLEFKGRRDLLDKISLNTTAKRAE